MTAKPNAPAASTPRSATGVANKAVRRTQEERSSATRARVINAAIKCLHQFGYGGTSTTLVADEAGVSRGAMLHQFPTKSDLMLAVVRAVFEQDGELYERSMEAVSPRQWMLGLPSTMWEVISRPAGIAVIEIMLASRSDADLAKQLRAVQQQINREARTWVLERLEDAGLTGHPDEDAIHRLFVAAVRGLALEQLFMRNKAEVMKSIAVLSNVLRQLYPDLDR